MNEKSELAVFDGYDKQKIDVMFQEEANLEVKMPLFYVNSGKKELENYVEDDCKPKLTEYTVSKQEELSALVEEVYKPELATYTDSRKEDILYYVENTSKPEIDDYVAAEVTPHSTSAQSAAASALASKEAAESSAQQASDIVDEFDVHAAAKQTAFDTNAATKTSTFDNNAATKQASVDASAEMAKKYAQGTIQELSSGSSKYWSEKAKESAESIDVSSFAKTDANNTFTGVNQFNSKITRTTNIDISQTTGEQEQDVIVATDNEGKELGAIHYARTNTNVNGRLRVLNRNKNNAWADLRINNTDEGKVYASVATHNTLSTNLDTSINNSTTLANTKFVHDVVNEAMSKVFGAGHIGQIGYTARTSAPEGCAWCDGAEYTQAQFPDVYQMLVDNKIARSNYTNYNTCVSSYGSCGFFGLDTTNKKFKVPTLTNIYIKAGQSPVNAGKESLPNITGTFDGNCNGYTTTYNATGAFYKTSGDNRQSDSNGNSSNSLGFDASRSSSTYKDGAKVNPDHVVYRSYVVLYSSAVEASTAQAAEFIESLSTKANTDLSNVSSNIAYIVESYKNGTSGYIVYSNGFCEQWGAISIPGNQIATVQLLKNFKDVNYCITNNKKLLSVEFTDGWGAGDFTVSSFRFANGHGSEITYNWHAVGFIS